MTMNQIRNEFTNEMKKRDYDKRMTAKLRNDIHMLLWVEHCLTTMSDEYPTINDLFNDMGFIEGLEMQYESPISFDDMIA